MPDTCGFDYVLRNNYFKAPSQEVHTTSVASDLPNGHAWTAKIHTSTVIYALVYAVVGAYRLIAQLFETLAREFNLYTSVLLLPVWEKSVGLPDPRIGRDITDLCDRRRLVRQRLSKIPIVTVQEMQQRIDETWPDYGIWLETGPNAGAFRYTFRYTFEHDGVRDRFNVDVHIPWLAIDPDDPINSPLTLDNLFSFLRDFFPSYITLIPIFEPQASYAVITNPQNRQTVYSRNEGANFTIFPVSWKEIDVDGTVVNHQDTEEILPTTTEITRSFTDSTVTLIDDTNEITVIILP